MTLSLTWSSVAPLLRPRRTTQKHAPKYGAVLLKCDSAGRFSCWSRDENFCGIGMFSTECNKSYQNCHCSRGFSTSTSTQTEFFQMGLICRAVTCWFKETSTGSDAGWTCWTQKNNRTYALYNSKVCFFQLIQKFVSFIFLHLLSTGVCGT